MLRNLIGENIELGWTPGEGVAAIKLDAAQLNQILVNLCLNARDAIDDVGIISIETAMTLIDEQTAHIYECKPGRYVCLKVSDDGRGMSEETKEHLFEPFYTTKPMGKGTGLGLATIHGIVRQHNGAIHLSSNLGQGTVVSIYWPPFEEGEFATYGEKGTELPLASNETVLVVEDEEAILELAVTQLAALGYNVLSAATPALAIDLALAHVGKIDLLLTDVVLPDMNGSALADKLADLRPGIRALFMTGYSTDIVARYSTLDSSNLLLHKPFSRESLAQAVQKALSQPILPRGEQRNGSGI